MWQTAEAWGYVHHDPFRGVRLPQMVKAEQPYFTWKKSEKSLRHRQNLTGRSTGLLRKPGFVPVSCAACGGGTLGRTPCT
jgi:hypothetical protein